MARISGVNLPEEKRVDIGLTAIFGLGRQNVKKILKKAAVEPAKRIKELTAGEITKLAKIIEQYPVEGALRKQEAEDVKRLRTIGAYRGQRHSQGLPVRGQRTRSNARTRRGKRKTVGAMRKKDMSRLETAKKGKGDE